MNSESRKPQNEQHVGSGTLSRLFLEAEQDYSLLRENRNLSVERIALAMEKPLAIKNVQGLNQIFEKLPKETFSSPQILSCLLRFLFLSGEENQAKKIAQDLLKDTAEISDAGLDELVQKILREPQALESLKEPRVIDYELDLHDSHYSMNMLLICEACGCEYLEKTGWGIMILRPTYCTCCLEPRLISPDFLVSVFKKYHIHDGGDGFRKVDRELLNLVTTWHLKEDFPAEGYLDGMNLANPLVLPILRMLIRGMYLERYVKTEGNAA